MLRWTPVWNEERRCGFGDDGRLEGYECARADKPQSFSRGKAHTTLHPTCCSSGLVKLTCCDRMAFHTSCSVQSLTESQNGNLPV